MVCSYCRYRRAPRELADAVPRPPHRLLVRPGPPAPRHPERPRPSAGAAAPAPAAAPLRAPGEAAAALALREGAPGEPGRQATRPRARPPGVLAEKFSRPLSRTALPRAFAANAGSVAAELLGAPQCMDFSASTPCVRRITPACDGRHRRGPSGRGTLERQGEARTVAGGGAPPSTARGFDSLPLRPARTTGGGHLARPFLVPQPR